MPASPSRPRLAVDLRALVPAPTGIGVYTRALLLELARLDRFELVGMAHKPPHFAAELGAAGIAIEVQPAPLGVIWQQAVLPRRLRRGDIDLFWSPITTLPWSCPVPSVVTIHDLTAVLLPEMHRFKVRWSVLPFLRRSLEEAAAVLTDSQATALEVAFHFPQSAAKLRVVYPGIDSEFHPPPPARSRARAPSSARRRAICSMPARSSRARASACCSTHGARCAGATRALRRSCCAAERAGRAPICARGSSACAAKV
jgi:glycosyltransferase involved in cell wall biosynthesis